MRNIQPAFAAIAIAMWLPLLLAVSALGGCQTGTTGPLRPIADTVYTPLTNVITVAVQSAAAAAPAPFGSAAQAAGAAVLALLAAWQAVTHNTVRKLANGAQDTSHEEKS